MNKSKSKTNSFLSNNSLLREILATFFFTIGIFSLISLIIFSSKFNLDVKGIMGNVGLYISYSLVSSFGICSFIFPFLTFYISYFIFTNKINSEVYKRLISSVMFLLSITTLTGIIYSENTVLGYTPAGGRIGNTLSKLFTTYVSGTIGSYILVTVFTLLSLLTLTGTKIIQIFTFSNSLIMDLFNQLSNYFHSLKNRPEATGINDSTKIDDEDIISDKNYKPKEIISFEEFKKLEREKPAKEDLKKPIIIIEEEKQEKNNQEVVNLNKVISSNLKSSEVKTKKEFELPPIDLLDTKIDFGIEIDRQSIYTRANLIEDKLKDFGIKGKVTEVRPGPVITMFEYKPAPGIKINKIASLENDLAMGLSALSIRIVAPIPGKDVIGIEVPNSKREMVVLRELIEDVGFTNKDSILTLALGKDISGKPFYMNLRNAPHLMIAGTTGSGKSVLLNAVLTSLLYKANPTQLKFIMIDPKMLELSIYEDIPHLLHPVVTEPKKAAAALRWAVQEMELRYKLLSEEGTRDIESYNKKIEKLDSEEKRKELLPYIVIVLDELADLMMTAQNEIKESITRLAQKARAAGIHIIVATQRPSADVVAGLIKANFPVRISFRVSSKVDSRIILDTMGAERLLGKGDMLFLQPGSSSLIRLQGALISDKEREKITNYLKSQDKPEYIEEITHIEDTDEKNNFDDEKDELYDTALRIIVETKHVSISMLQRRLKIGYNRAARIVEIMEKEGIVGQQEAAGKPREVYIDANQLKETQIN